jgi:3-hydroxyisobutyrate dehydrogenase-like beta-hydroxyacid dehydrogenase
MIAENVLIQPVNGLKLRLITSIKASNKLCALLSGQKICCSYASSQRIISRRNILQCSCFSYFFRKEDDTMAEQIGFIGLGNMGRPIAQNLQHAGHQLHVYNRDPKKAQPLVEMGAQQGKKPREVVQPGGIVFTMLSNDAALLSVTEGENGFLEHLGPGGLHISLSTISPSLSEHMAKLHAEHNVQYVAAPVFGRPAAAADRELWIALAGPEKARQRARPLLEAIGQGTFEFGEEAAAANTIKICSNFLITSAQEAMAEALTLAEKSGIERTQLINMLTKTIFACGVYQNYGKMIAERNFIPVGLPIELAQKDLDLVLGAAEQAKVSMPFASQVHNRLLSSIAKGRGEMDWTALSLGVDDDAGLQSLR